MDYSNGNRFTTTDISLAAYLLSQGIVLIDVETDIFPSKFIFQNDNPQISDFARDFHAGIARGNILDFYKSYRELLRKVH